jgi:hypothetical protein
MAADSALTTALKTYEHPRLRNRKRAAAIRSTAWFGSAGANRRCCAESVARIPRRIRRERRHADGARHGTVGSRDSSPSDSGQTKSHASEREMSAMSQPCENIDGQCGASWCDCDYQRRKRAGSFAAPSGSPAIPRVLFDGCAVWDELKQDDRAARRTSSENVSDVLDAVVRILRRENDPSSATASIARPERKGNDE